MTGRDKGQSFVAPQRDFKRRKWWNSASYDAGSDYGPEMKQYLAENYAPEKRLHGNLLVRLLSWVIGIILRLFWWLAIRAVVVLTILLCVVTGYYYVTLPGAAALMDDRQRGSVTLLDEAGEIFTWRGDQFGGLIDVNFVAPQLRNAVVAAEDKRFYRHWGISLRGIAGAMRTNLLEGRHPLKGHGGSTITQQVAKRVFFSDLGTIERKIKEIPMAFAMELKYTKDEILTIYINRAYLGAGSHGFEAASQRYFSKSASEVSVPEAAMLAGLLKAPSYSAPTRHIGRAQDRANLIIRLMNDQGYLTDIEAAAARANPAQLSEVAMAQAGGYFADWIMESGPAFILKDSTEDLVIGTTFDKRIQQAAEDGLNFIFDTKVKQGSEAQAAVVVLSPDGAVRAIVGGKKSGIAGEFNRATQALRQTGSSFKPFVYAAALDDGWRWNTIVVDEPFCLEIPNSSPYCPKNYHSEFQGEMLMTTALARSVNTVAVKIADAVGFDRVRDIARGFGIQNELARGPAVALGASESTLLEMTGAYAGILNQGVAVTPYGITELILQGDSTPLLEKPGETGGEIISEHAARQLIFMMNQAVRRGTGYKAQIEDVQIAGKTGTTQRARDAWFIAFTSDYVAGVWMGYDDNTRLSGVTGGGLPAEIWREIMGRILDGTPPAPLPMFTPRADGLEFGPGAETLTPDAESIWRELAQQEEDTAPEAQSDEENVLERLLNGIFGWRDN